MSDHYHQLINMDPQTQSPFFRLPQELRDMIYNFIFEGAEVPKPGSQRLISTRGTLRKGEDGLLHGGKREGKGEIPSGILLSCKQAFLECVEIFYKTTTFRFADWWSAHTWMGCLIPRTYAACITKVIINIDILCLDRAVKDGNDVEINDHYSELPQRKMQRKYEVTLNNIHVEIVVEEDVDANDDDDDDYNTVCWYEYVRAQILSSMDEDGW